MRWLVPGLALAVSLVLSSDALAASRGTPAEISRALNAHKKDPSNPMHLTDLGSQFALRASEAGAPSDIEDARKYLRQSLKMDAKNAETVAWLGVLRCIEAKVRQSKGFVREGLSQLDHATEMAPSDLRVRMLRGSVGVEVPREFNRLDGGIADLETVRAAHESDPHALAALRIDPAEVFLKIGKGYRAKGNMEGAKQMWSRAAEAPSGRERESAMRLLTKYFPGTRAAGR